MYKLYFAPGACSLAVHVALNEMNQPVELEKVDIRGTRTPEFMKINPRGQVPVLVDGDQVVREGAAILIHIAEKHQSPLLPKSEPARTAALEWLMFCNATLHPAYSRCFFLMRNAPEQAKEQLLGTAIAMVNKLWAEVEQRLGQNQFLVGETMTLADILATVIGNWGDHLPAKPEIGPLTRRLFKTVSQRPAFQKALQTEQVEYKAAA